MEVADLSFYLQRDTPAMPGETVVVSISANDDAALGQVSLFVENIQVPLDANMQYTFTSTTEDTIALKAYAEDVNGNSDSAVSSIIISSTVDNVGPVVTLSASTDHPLVGSGVSFTVAASDRAIDHERVWFSIDGEYLQPETDGHYIWHPLKQGLFTALATAYDSSGNFGSASLPISVSIEGSDIIPPNVSILTPENDSVILTKATITGSATDENFAYYTLGYQREGDVDFTEFKRSELPVDNGVLGQFDASLLENGMYTIRCTAFDRYGNSAFTNVVVYVEGQLKIGNFTLAFSDLKVPAAGLDLEVMRNYDSRIKRLGDFGYGWNLDIRSMRLQESCKPGEYWNVTKSLSRICFMGHCYETRSYSLSPLRKHTITINIPNGPAQVFKVTPHFYSITSGLNINSAEYGYFTFDPQPGTYSTLTPLNVGNFVVKGGEVYDEDGWLDEPYNPQQYKLTLRDGSTYLFDQNQGGLIQVNDLNGNTIDVGQNTLSHSAGLGINISRDSIGRISSIVDNSGRTIRYEYDGHGNLQKVIDAKGNITRFKYAPGHYLTEIIDARGIRAARTEYDSSGRMVRQIGPAGDTVTFDHDLDNNREVTKDFNGNEMEYTYDNRGNVLTKTDAAGAAWIYTYDSLDNIEATRSPDGTTRSSTWENGNELTTTDELNQTTTRTFNSRGQVVTETDVVRGATTHTYDPVNGNLLYTTGPDGTIISMKSYAPNGNVRTEMDGMGNLTQYGYDTQGRMTSRIDPLGRVTSYLLDSRGNTTAEISANGDTTKYFYDLNNNQIMMINTNGDTTRSGYNVFNKVASQIDAQGNQTRFEYDIFGQLKKTVAPDSTFTQKNYDAQGNVLTAVDEVGRVTSFEYDHENRVVKTVFNDGSASRTEYDSRGCRMANIDRNGNRTEYEYDAVGNNTIVRDALGHETTYEYDAANRRMAMADALGHRTEYTYDDYDRLIKTTFDNNTFSTVENDLSGRKIAEVDQAGKRTEFTYDSCGNLRTVKDAMLHVTEYTYDKNNNRITQTDASAGLSASANNHTTSMSYDKQNRLTSRTYPNGDRETFAYDANGNTVAKVDGAGDSTVYTYDSRNREVLRRFTNSGHVVETRYAEDGRPDTVIDHRGMTVYRYDENGRQAKVTNPDPSTGLGASGGFIESRYDSQGNRTVQKMQFDSTFYVYDSLNRMTTVTSSNGTTRYQYNAVGNRDSLTNANGTAVGYAYDELNRLTSVTNYSPDGSVLSSFTYALNNAGIRTVVTESDASTGLSTSGSRVDYIYDDCYKLIGETRSGSSTGSPAGYSIVYTYDNVGNRLTRTRTLSGAEGGVTTSYVYNNRDQLTSEDSAGVVTSYTYDNAGRMMSKTTTSTPLSAGAGATTTYSWEDNDRMVEVNGPGMAIHYMYDHNGQRVRESTAADTTNYLIDYQLPYGQVIAETDGSGNLVATYVYGLDRLSQNRNSILSTYQLDGQGSIRSLTNSVGSLTDTYWYTAFGEELARTGSTDNRFRYVGEQWDGNAGFYYNRARWYSPGVGRFTSVDPFAGDPQSPVSLHRYLYANVCPISMRDPSGRMTLGEVLMIPAVQSILIGVGASASGYALSVVFSKFTAPEKTYSELWSWKDFSISVASGGITSYALEIKVVAKMGILTVNVISSVVTGGAIRATTEGGNAFDLSGILTDVIGAYIGDRAAGKGNNHQIINVIRGVMSGPAGTTASAGTQIAVDIVKDGAGAVQEKAIEVFIEIENQIHAAYGVN